MLGLLNSWVLEFKIYFKFLPQSTTSKYFFNILTSADAKPRNKKKIPQPHDRQKQRKIFLVAKNQKLRAIKRAENIQAEIIHRQEMKPVSAEWIFLSRRRNDFYASQWWIMCWYMLKYLPQTSGTPTKETNEKTSQTTFMELAGDLLVLLCLCWEWREIEGITTTAAAFTWRHFYWKVIPNERCVLVKRALIVFDSRRWLCCAVNGVSRDFLQIHFAMERKLRQRCWVSASIDGFQPSGFFMFEAFSDFIFCSISFSCNHF